MRASIDCERPPGGLHGRIGSRAFAKHLLVEHGQNAVAHEFQNVAAMAEHGVRDPVEIGVQDGGHFRAAEPVGQLGEAAHVRHEDDRVDGLAVAPLDLAVQDTLAGDRAEIGVGDIAGDPLQDVPFDMQGQKVDQVADPVLLPARKTARPRRCEGHGVEGLARRAEGQGDIGGIALFGQFLHQGRGLPAFFRLQVQDDHLALE